MNFGINENWENPLRRYVGKPFVDEIGANCVRANALWAQVQAWGPDGWDWSVPDAMIGDFYESMDTLFIICAIAAPPWAMSPADRADWERVGYIVRPPAPEFDGAYAEFVRRLADRYGMVALEVWNEPNLPNFGKLSAKRAGELVKAARVGLTASSQPDLPLLSPAPYPNMGWDGYLRTMLDHASGARFSVACHPYSRNGEWMRAFQETTTRFDITKRIAGLRSVWVTEVGFSSKDLGLRGQEKACRETFWYLRRKGARSIVWHRLAADRDYQPDNEWEQNLGVCNSDWSKKPAFGALASAALGVLP